VSAQDAKGVSTGPVPATLAAGGSFTATIPSAALAPLANGPLTVGGDYTVPDVATNAPADIGGVTLSADKETPAATPQPAAPGAPPAAKIAMSGLHVRSAITAKSAKAGKLRASFVVPSGAQFIRVRLWRTGYTAALDVFPAAKAGTRQKIAVTGVKRSLKKGHYTLTVSASPVRTMFVGPSLRALVRVR
jgi:hypothetical protein